MTEKQAKLLAYPFTADEIEWRVLLTTKDKSKGQVAAYIDSRAIQKRLDDVLGTLSRTMDGECIVLTGDRDSLQLVSETTRVFRTVKGVTDIEVYDLARLAEDGYEVLSGPRTTGDGYYESSVLGFEGVNLEITA